MPMSVVFLNLPAPNFLMQDPSLNQELIMQLSRLASSSGLGLPGPAIRRISETELRSSCVSTFRSHRPMPSISYRAILEMRG